MSKTKVYSLKGFSNRLEKVMNEHSDPYWARITGKHRKTCLAYRHGYTVPDATTLGKICAEAKVSANWILFGKEM